MGNSHDSREMLAGRLANTFKDSPSEKKRINAQKFHMRVCSVGSDWTERIVFLAARLCASKVLPTLSKTE
jgi:hypothetical protein